METILDALPQICLFKRLTGWLCPGCGMTHAFFAVLRGDLRQAVNANALSPLLFLALLTWTVTRRAPPRPLLITGFVVALAYGILRNL